MKIKKPSIRNIRWFFNNSKKKKKKKKDELRKIF